MSAGEATTNSSRDLSDAKQRVLDVAERLFMQRGYAAITLRDIADALNMRQASLYYHFPEGKEQLFVAVATLVFERHQAGMQRAIDTAEADLASRMHALAGWFASQPPLNLLGMTHADFPALSESNAHTLAQIGYRALFTPLRNLFLAAQDRGEIRTIHPDLLAGCFLALIDSASVIRQQPTVPPRHSMVDEMILVLLEGLYPRPAPVACAQSPMQPQRAPDVVSP
ncbi:MAG: TetR/AcrR family transcriptional regulator [Caldilineaceae bacterium]|nr:TetR/AcrR family transcriptional regulator [Caldilineaceae bacterium]